MRRFKLAAIALLVIVAVVCTVAVVIGKLAPDVQAQTPATLEPERWEDPEYPVACYRSPGDVAWSCVTLPTEEAYEDEGPQS